MVETGSASGDVPAMENPHPVVDAAVAHVAKAACELAILPIEDLLGLEEQPNLPGTLDEHPNWRRRLEAPVETVLEIEAVSKRLASFQTQPRR
jgi:4-alpha-glucanotransferase